MGLDVETDQISSQQPIHQFALPRTDPKRFRIRPGNVPEDRHPRFRPLLFDHARQQCEVVILHQHHRVFRVRHFLQQGIGELPIHFLVMLPVVRAKQRPSVRDMAERPQAFVGEPVVISLLFFFGKPDAAQSVMRIVRRNRQAIMHIDGIDVAVS